MTYKEEVVRVEDISTSLDMEKSRSPPVVNANNGKLLRVGNISSNKKGGEVQPSGPKNQYDYPACSTVGKTQKSLYALLEPTLSMS